MINTPITPEEVEAVKLPSYVVEALGNLLVNLGYRQALTATAHLVEPAQTGGSDV